MSVFRGGNQHIKRLAKTGGGRGAAAGTAAVGFASVVTVGALVLTTTAMPAVGADAALGRAAVSEVTSATLTDTAVRATKTPLELLRSSVRCLDVGAGEQYCMHIGFTSKRLSADDLDKMLVAASKGPELDFGTATLLGAVRQYAAEPYERRIAEDQREIDQAVATAIKSADLRQSVRAEVAAGETTEGSKRGKFARGSARADTPGDGQASAGVGVSAELPARKGVQMGFGAQVQNFYCGPASVYSVAAGHTPTTDQSTWAYRLGTTSDSGTAVSRIPGVLNYFTDRDRGGNYQSVSTGDTDADTYLAYVRKAVAVRNHPAIQQVKLWKAFFPYVRVDHGGHFQPVNGYDATKRTILFSEVYDEATYMSNGAPTAGPKELPVNAVFGANKASYNAAPGVFGRIVI